jgi:hypothetical protein
VRLGQILQRGDDYRVVLTPHCHLVVQAGQNAPRADYVLAAKTVAAKAMFEAMPLRGNEAEKIDNLRRRIQSPAGFGQPRGRYWFLPGFLAMPDLYVDFLQLESLEYSAIVREPEAEGELEWVTFAVLDAPFAEALQSCFVGFYSAVGLPSLDPRRFPDLYPNGSSAPTSG